MVSSDQYQDVEEDRSYLSIQLIEKIRLYLLKSIRNRYIFRIEIPAVRILYIKSTNLANK